MLRKGMIWMPMDKKDQLAELISNAETSFYNGQLQEAFSLSLSAIKLDENCNISKLPAETRKEFTLRWISLNPLQKHCGQMI